MNNRTASSKLADCSTELTQLQLIIQVMGQSNPIVPFLTNYAIMKCCGTIESCFKIIITDFHSTLPSQARNYIENTFLNSSMNPSKENICSSLKKFDPSWNTSFKNKLSLEIDKARIEGSLSSLNDARNAFAHGSSASISFASVITYFNDSKRVIELLDEVII